MALSEATIINQIALYERSISGVKNSYDFAKNPDNLTSAMLPAVLHYIPNFTAKPLAHFNVWDNVINARSILCVAPRQSQGGRLTYLENDAMPYLGKWREKFQDSTVITSILAATGTRICWLDSGNYGAGGILTVGSIEFIGAVFSFTFKTA